MIYAADVTKFDCTRAELEERLLFWLVVAGKEANMMAQKLEDFLLDMWVDYSEQPPSAISQQHKPFVWVRRAIEDGSLGRRLQQTKMGKYETIERGMREIVHLDPSTCTVEQLEAIHGIGPKSARCFLLHSRPNQRLAGLDTHILKFLRAAGCDAPYSTPAAGRRYHELEQAFLKLADDYGLTPADLDLRVWNHFAGRAPLKLPKKKAA